MCLPPLSGLRAPARLWVICVLPEALPHSSLPVKQRLPSKSLQMGFLVWLTPSPAVQSSEFPAVPSGAFGAVRSPSLWCGDGSSWGFSSCWVPALPGGPDCFIQEQSPPPGCLNSLSGSRQCCRTPTLTAFRTIFGKAFCLSVLCLCETFKTRKMARMSWSPCRLFCTAEG